MNLFPLVAGIMFLGSYRGSSVASHCLEEQWGSGELFYTLFFFRYLRHQDAVHPHQEGAYGAEARQPDEGGAGGGHLSDLHLNR